MSPRIQRLRAEIASDLQIFASRVEVLTSVKISSGSTSFSPTLAGNRGVTSEHLCHLCRF
jgi:hypothetical protein